MPTRSKNELNHTFKVIANVRRGDAQRVHTMRRQPIVSPPVPLRIRAELVREAVDLNTERRFVTEEIEGVWPNRVLAAELERAGAIAEHTP